MDKSSIIGGFLEELGETVKKGAEQVSGKGEFAPPKTAPTQTTGETRTGNVDNIGAMRTEEERDKAKNLAAVRQSLSQMMAPPRQQEPRPQERVERQRQQERQELERKEAQEPPPLVVSRAKTQRERGKTSG